MNNLIFKGNEFKANRAFEEIKACLWSLVSIIFSDICNSS